MFPKAALLRLCFLCLYIIMHVILPISVNKFLKINKDTRYS